MREGPWDKGRTKASFSVKAVVYLKTMRSDHEAIVYACALYSLAHDITNYAH